MRSSKSILAGIAAGALALGGLAIASAPAATAAKSMKPKASVTATVSPVRATISGGALDAVPFAALSWTTSATLAAGDTVTVALATAPSPTASLGIVEPDNGANGIGSSTGGLAVGQTYLANSSEDVYLGTPPVTLSLTGGGAAAYGTAAIGVAVTEAGSYSGVLTSYASGVAKDTVAFAFTTTGKAASMSIAPGSQNVAVNGTATLALTLKDSSGKTTQPLVVDSIATSVAPTGAGSPSLVTTTGSGAGSLYDGVAAILFIPNTAGAYSVTATPAGTLPAGGVTAQSGAVIAATTANFTAVNVVAPTKGVSTNPFVYTAPTAETPIALANLYASTTVRDITFGIAGTAGSLVAYSVTDGVIPAGVTSGAGTTTIGADGTGTVKVSASAPAVGSNYTVSFGPPAGNQVTYTVTYEATGALDAGNIKTVPPAGTATYVKDGTAQPVSVSVTDQFGLPLQGVTVASVASVSAAASGVTGADGKAVLSIPAPVAGTTSQTVLFSASALGSTVVTATPITLIYNASGAPTSLTASSTAGTVAATALATQYVDVSGAVLATWAATDTNTAKGWMQVNATVGGGVTGVPVIFTGKDVYFAESNALTLAEADKDTSTAVTIGGVASIFVKATKTGTATITMQAGTLTAPITWSVANTAADARVLEVTPATQDATSPAQVRAKVTDAFGNPVALAGLAFAEEGVGNFASGTSTLVTFTGPNGEVVVDVVAAEKGLSTVTVQGGTGANSNYNGAADSPVSGAPKGVSLGQAKINFGVSRAITITGSRTTVSGKPGIKIDGAVTGIENGKTVIPYFRFPGETTFAQGTARPVISGGKFTWERKTGKKFYAYVTSDDGKVTSNRVVIAAN